MKRRHLLAAATALPTNPINFHPIEAMQLIKWDGKTRVPFGAIIEGA